MMEPIFHDGKKSCVSDKKNLETEQNDFLEFIVFWEERYSAFTTWFSFSVNKKQKKLQN